MTRIPCDVRVLAVLRCIGPASCEAIYTRLYKWCAASTVAHAVLRLRKRNRIAADASGRSRRGRVANKYRMVL